MNRFYRRLIASLTMAAFFLQLFMPIVVSAQENQTQKSVIEQAKDEFQVTYDKIMAIEEIDLGSITSEILRMIWNCENAIPIPRDDKGITTPDQSREWAAKMQAQQEKAKLEGYLAQIKKANEDIKKIKWDAIKTRISLTNGSLEKAAETDPTKVYNSLDKNSSALAIYQEALKKAGNALLTAAGALDSAATALDLVTKVCLLVSGSVALAPFTAPIAAITGPLAGICTAAGFTLTIAGESLISAADNAISGDKEFAELVGNICAKEFAKAGIDKASGNIIGGMTKGVGESYADLYNQMDPEEIEKFLNYGLSQVANPIKSPLKQVIEDATVEKNKHIGDEKTEDEKIMMPAFIKPQLNWED